MITKDSKRIMLADDSEFFRAKIGDTLTEAGHHVIFAKDGQDAIEKIKAGGLDLLLLDLHMPVLDGFQVLKWVQDSGYGGKFPILASTAFYEPGEIIEKVKALGASGLMPKSTTPEQMVFRVNSVLFHNKASEGSQRKRVPASIPAEFSIGDSFNSGVILNISESGLFLHTDMDLLIGAVMHVKFSVPGREGVIDAKGTVRWTTGDASEKTVFGGSGIMFTSISDEDKEKIASFVEVEAKRLGLYEEEPPKAGKKLRAG